MLNHTACSSSRQTPRSKSFKTLTLHLGWTKGTYARYRYAGGSASKRSKYSLSIKLSIRFFTIAMSGLNRVASCWITSAISFWCVSSFRCLNLEESANVFLKHNYRERELNSRTSLFVRGQRRSLPAVHHHSSSRSPAFLPRLPPDSRW